MKSFFLSLKTSHLSIVNTIDVSAVRIKIFLSMLIITLISSFVLMGVFGNELLSEIKAMIEADGGTWYTIPQALKPWLPIIVAGINIIGEIIWISIIAFITARVLVYKKTPLGFGTIFFLYALVRTYEMCVGLALLLGRAIPALSIEKNIHLLETGMGVQTMVSFVAAVILFWIYIWTIKYTVLKKYPHTKKSH